MELKVGYQSKTDLIWTKGPWKGFAEYDEIGQATDGGTREAGWWSSK